MIEFNSYPGKTLIQMKIRANELCAALSPFAGVLETSEAETAVPDDSPVTIRCQLGDVRRARAAMLGSTPSAQPAQIDDAVLRQILSEEYKRAGSTVPFKKHEKYEGPWIKICYSAMRRAVELARDGK